MCLIASTAPTPLRDFNFAQQFKRWSPAPVEGLSLRGWGLAFKDTFDRFDVTGPGGAGPWFAPGHADFGASHFAAASDRTVIMLSAAPGCEGHCLSLGDQKGGSSWRSGLVRSVNGKGQGLSFVYGYFEARCKVPLSRATWPAFWLLTTNGLTDPTATRGEIDVFEHYGSNPFRLHASLHLWPADLPKAGSLDKPLHTSHKVTRTDLAFGFHRYGVMVGPRWITFFFDGDPVARHATSDAYRAPKYMLLDLAMTDKGLRRAADHSEMLVDEVRVFTPPADLKDY